MKRTLRIALILAVCFLAHVGWCWGDTPATILDDGKTFWESGIRPKPAPTKSLSCQMGVSRSMRLPRIPIGPVEGNFIPKYRAGKWIS